MVGGLVRSGSPRVSIVLTLAAASLTLGVGFTVHAAYRAIRDHPPERTALGEAAAGHGRENHFPGFALSDVEQHAAAPATGVTGTTDLPARPIDALLVDGDAGVVSARPFTTLGTSAVDRARALTCLTSAIYYEAGSESDAGQRAVAQVVLNRVRHPAFPATVCGVVYQGVHAATVSEGCQFSFACDGATTRVPERSAWRRAASNAAMALAGYVYAPVGLATHYHTYAVRPAWNRSLVMTDVVGAHFFHRWKGYWGTTAAFSQRYRGGEPASGTYIDGTAIIPIAPIEKNGTATDPLFSPSSGIAEAPTSAITRQLTPPRQIGGGSSGAQSIQTDSLPPRSEVLDQWKNSGQPL